MAFHHVRRFGCVITLSTVAIASFLVANPAHAQDRKAPQSAGVDNTKMGPYRALAQLAFSASQKGDNATAATLAKVLERTWDKGEDYGGDTALSKTNKKLFEEIDKAMDSFVNLLVEHAATGADQGKLKIVYNAYLSKLKLAD
jgi:hypothetical protein